MPAVTPLVPRSGSSTPAAPWWRHGHVWLVIAGPVAVVLASAVTLGLALRQSDPVLTEDAYRRGLDPRPRAEAGQALKAQMPAMQARNHAASPAPGPQPVPATPVLPAGAGPAAGPAAGPGAGEGG